MIHSYKKIYGKTHSKLVLLSSTVSSAILKSMAKIEGIKFEVSYLKFEYIILAYGNMGCNGKNFMFCEVPSYGCDKGGGR